MTATTRIFVSYRHDDTASDVNRLVKRLQKTQSGIFRDKSRIQAGEDFPRKLETALGEAGIILVVIGKQWLDTIDSFGQRRLDDPDDFVRREVAYGIRRAGADRFVDIIPVLVADAKMPQERDLPDVLQPLAARDATKIRGEKFDADVDLLSERIDALYAEHQARADNALDEFDEYLSAKRKDIGETLSMCPTYARDPDLHDLPLAAEWECTWCNGLFKARFETLQDYYFEAEVVQPADFKFEGHWAYKPGPDETLVLVLDGKTLAGADYKVAIPIQEKLGRNTYAGRSGNGDYYRLECLRRNPDYNHF